MDVDDLNDAAQRINAHLKDGGVDAAAAVMLSDADDASLGRPSHRLAVYGTLAPGRSNHHVIASIGGEWVDGRVEGAVHTIERGAAVGFPAFRWTPGGPRVAVCVLTDAGLPAHWPRLDLFEGPDYRRILVPVFGDAAEPKLAFIYAARD